MAISEAKSIPQKVQTLLVTGGARSGKSERAEKLTLASGLTPIYVATGAAFDEEMAKRIHQHQERRGAHWHLIEEAVDLAGVIDDKASRESALLIDCLTLWLSNLTFGAHGIEACINRLCASLGHAKGPVVLVTNEVGQGVVPQTQMGRSFRDDQGRLNQRVAEVVDGVEYVVAGQPLQLKPALAPPFSLLDLTNRS